MLVLTRKFGERILIGDSIVITVLDGRGKIKLGVEAPRDIPVHREEVLDAHKKQGEARPE